MLASAILCASHTLPEGNAFSIRREHGHVVVRSRLYFATVMAPETSADEEEEQQLTSALLSIPVYPNRKQVELHPPSMPPWLERHKRSLTDDELDQDIAWLEYGILEKGFSVTVVQEIVKCIHMTAGGNLTKMAGIVDFLRLILQLKLEEPQGWGFLTREVLLASILHYDECLTAREQGVYDWIQVAVQSRRRAAEHQAIASSKQNEVSITLHPTANCCDIINFPDTVSTSALTFPAKSSTLIDFYAYEDYCEDDVRLLAKGAARIKRAEILAHTVLGASRLSSKEESSKLRGLLLSVMDDWRALAIRCVACLYRLEGILHDWEHGRSQYLERTPEVIQTAKDALNVYATLSQRLGMHGLKAQLEDRAFRILYRRQYQAVSSLYRETGGVMQSVASYMTAQITQVLNCDTSLMAQLEMVQVCARVKEPFSFWKKLLKVRGNKSLLGSHAAGSLSVTNVQDGVALRVILQARKWTPDEPDETTQNRERILCYYVQNLIRSRWPAVDQSRIKDYIQNPKANGYQSLHFTSAISCRDQEFPFEIQVRSEEMHRSAEFGIAAHWDYKLGSKTMSGMTPPKAIIEDRDLLNSAAITVGKENVADISALCDREQAPGVHQHGTRSLNRSYIDALVNSKQSLVQQNVYAFFTGSFLKEQGRLVALPAGARITDGIAALRQDKSAAEEKRDLAVWRNGRLAAVSDIIANGDVIMLDGYS